MAELKTKATDQNVVTFLESIAEDRRADCQTLINLMKKATKAEPVMWGASIIGFGKQHLKYASGRELDWFTIGFSPRKDSLSLYLTNCIAEYQTTHLAKLGKHKVGKGCLYIKKLADVDMAILSEMIQLAASGSA